MAKILVVDDAVFMRSKSMRLLADHGYAVDEASNGSDAVKKYVSIKPDVVLMDITMPVMDGVTALKEIVRLDPNAKVIMVTALGQQSMVIEALKAGAKDFIVKPFDPGKVILSIKQLVDQGV